MARIKPLPRDRIAYRYRQQYGVIIVCKDETSQRCAFNRLRRQGYKLRVVTV
jgi:hypothetical protein